MVAADLRAFRAIVLTSTITQGHSGKAGKPWVTPQLMGRAVGRHAYRAQMSKLVNTTGLLAVSAAVLECTAPTRPEWLLVRGYIEVETLGEVLVLPDTVQVDRAFGAVVTTFGSSTCTRPNGATVTVNGHTAEIVPYDSVPAPDRNLVCTADLRAFPRTVTLRFRASGVGTVRLIGRDDVSVTRTVIIQP